MKSDRWNDYASALVNTYGEPVYRIGIDGGFACPNRKSDGSGGCAYCDETGSVAAYQRSKERSLGTDFYQTIKSSPRCTGENRQDIERRKISILEQIRHGSAFLDRRYGQGGRSIYFQAFTSTFGSAEVLKELYDCALSTGTYREFIVSTRSDCLDSGIADLLASYKKQVDEVWVELGLQTANDSTLAALGRGETVDQFVRSCEIAQRSSLRCSAHVILGLPGESYEHIARTAAILRQVKVDAVKIHNLHIVAGSRYFQEYEAGVLTAPSPQRHLDYTIYLLRRLSKDMMIQRFVSDTPRHRLAAPRDFGDKHTFVRTLMATMKDRQVIQGDLV